MNSHSPRITSIDALRGIVMLLMLADHVREYFFLHRQVADPMDIETTEPSLFVARILAHLCPAIFIFLSGLSAFLYAQRYNADRATLSCYLISRGLFLVVLEVTLANFAWTFQFPPKMLYFQVIWAIGLSMIALAALIWLPLIIILAIGLAIIFGHNMLTPVTFTPESAWYIPWAILHDRSVIVIADFLSVRTSYPVLPWIAVIALGYVAGFGFKKLSNKQHEIAAYLSIGATMLTVFVLLRLSNLYGETAPWQSYSSITQTLMSFFNITKYPPSLLFVLLTLGVGFWIFAGLRKIEKCGWSELRWLAGFGKAPLFFYVVHLYVLHVLYQCAVLVFGKNQGERFGFDSIGENWILAAVLIFPLYRTCLWYLEFKKTHSYRWLNYI